MPSALPAFSFFGPIPLMSLRSSAPPSGAAMPGGLVPGCRVRSPGMAPPLRRHRPCARLRLPSRQGLGLLLQQLLRRQRCACLRRPSLRRLDVHPQRPSRQQPAARLRQPLQRRPLRQPPDVHPQQLLPRQPTVRLRQPLQQRHCVHLRRHSLQPPVARLQRRSPSRAHPATSPCPTKFPTGPRWRTRTRAATAFQDRGRRVRGAHAERR